ncbi:MAG: SDR family NAD(P)-dependent oxidoreductase [Chloracidobacterium sp.]|nr:SDR family NAD(P)-dependent oxidoreductase [Chloracidobacterium sp.]
MTHSIAIVGIACRYPDARNPLELWENVLSGRRAFRRIPAERLRLADYYAADRSLPDRIYSTEAAVIEGYEFDRARYRIAGPSFRSADMTHWLALDVAAQALEDAGFRNGCGLPLEATGVILGNTLTGEFSRANLMRLRWPYVRRVIDAELAARGWPAEQRRELLGRLETAYKSPFPEIGEESLAGGLSNTIAGRICNQFDLHGGGYVVDGACASSLLAISSACTALAAGDLDVALAGGVDLSLDPFELVGFAKTGALASDLMRVFDSRSTGFWPGEGCGFVTLMRREDALAQGRRIHALICGWGVSSDGAGGLTRPEVEGQMLALRRAYAKAGFSISAVPYFEGHGTGTAVGDATELKALTRSRLQADPLAPPAAIGSVKACVGHTKAAAGVAGVIKAVMAVSSQVLPPSTGTETPHPLLTESGPALRLLPEAEIWPAGQPLRAGVSSMGFGGINCHLVIEGVAMARRRALNVHERSLSASTQDAELCLLAGETAEELIEKINKLLTYADAISRAELSDLAAQLEKNLKPSARRAAVVASKPGELATGLQTIRQWLLDQETNKIDARRGCFLGSRERSPRVGLLFPGQASPARLDGGLWARRFDTVRELYESADFPKCADAAHTLVAQPAIVTASVGGLRVLNLMGIHACVATGHSLGELTALHWGGAIDEAKTLRLSAFRGRFMSELSNPNGAMSSISASAADVKILLNGDNAVIAGLNSPRQTVISGSKEAVAAVAERARKSGFPAVLLHVSHAFHSPLVADSVPHFADHLAAEDFGALTRRVVSTVTGRSLDRGENLKRLLADQIISPVRFVEALNVIIGQVDLLLEVGPGHVLSGLAGEMTDKPVIPLDACGNSLRGLLNAAAASFVLGAEIRHEALFAGRFNRPFALDWNPSFLRNPCELAPLPGGPAPPDSAGAAIVDASTREDTRESAPEPMAENEAGLAAGETPLQIVRQFVARKTELPDSAVRDDHRLLGDLHLNSITVSQIAIDVAKAIGLRAPVIPTDFSTLTVAEMAEAFNEMILTGGDQSGHDQYPPGIDSWIGIFTEELVERPPAPAPSRGGQGAWRVFAASGAPLESALRETFTTWGNGGVALALPPNPDERHVGLMLEAARASLDLSGASTFVLAQHNGGGAAFARTLHLETPHMNVCVVDTPPGHPQAIEWIAAEARAASGYSEAHYDDKGVRREPLLRPLPSLVSKDACKSPLSGDDVLLATGGGKGITFECALDLARTSGAALLLLGRSKLAEDGELRANFDRASAAGVRCRYLEADIINAESVRNALDNVAEFGPVTAVLHGAGLNSPKPLKFLDEEAFLRTLAPKLSGARNVLAALDPDRLKLFISLGSLIARTGMHGQADYALANEWLSRLTSETQIAHPHCLALCLEWSVWSGVGMGSRLGRLEALRQQGITAIPPEEGTAILRHILARRSTPGSLIITGRFGESPTLKLAHQDPPLRRFLERQRVWYPGVELVVESTLSVETDPYVSDHVFKGENVFPGVMGLEAMAQAAETLLGNAELWRFEDVRFLRSIVIPENRTVAIRIAALRRDLARPAEASAASEQVDVAIFSEDTGFQTEHFRARCAPIRKSGESLAFNRMNEMSDEKAHDRVELDPDHDLYGRILFHQGRFRRILGYRKLKARECVAEIRSDTATDWFGPFLPGKLTLCDIGVMDAAIHAVQACIPQATLLPIGVDEIIIRATAAPERLLVRAVERSRDGDLFTYDIDLDGVDGAPWQRWRGLHLRMVAQAEFNGPWAPALLTPYLERQIGDLIPGAELTVAFDSGANAPAALDKNAEAERRPRTDRAISRAIGSPARVIRRADGKPELLDADGRMVSVSHTDGLTMAVSDFHPVGCDLEQVVERSDESWRELLGENGLRLARLIASETAEELSSAATRVWTARESLRKAGAIAPGPLTLACAAPKDVAARSQVLLKSGAQTIATFVLTVTNAANQIAVSILTQPGTARSFLMAG